MGALVDRHYVAEGERTTGNLEGVITAIPENQYEIMTSRISITGEAGERSLGMVSDKTRFYNFQGSNVLMEHGLAQVGRAATADNESGFRMTRLFANSIEEMTALEQECALYSESTA